MPESAAAEPQAVGRTTASHKVDEGKMKGEQIRSVLLTVVNEYSRSESNFQSGVVLSEAVRRLNANCHDIRYIKV